MKKTYSVIGMTCGGCVKTVKALLSSVPGVSNVEVSLEKQTADLEQPEGVNLSDLQAKMKNFPYKIEESR